MTRRSTGLDYSSSSGTATLLAPDVLPTGVVVAALSAVVPYSLEPAALRRLPARTVGVLASLEPASAGLAGLLVLDEHLSAIQWAALACAGTASAGTVLRQGCGETTRKPPSSLRTAPEADGDEDMTRRP